MNYLRQVYDNELIYTVVDVYNKKKFQVKKYLNFLLEISSDVIDKPFYLAELPIFPSPLIVDIDIKECVENTEQQPFSLYSSETVKKIILTYSKVLNENLVCIPNNGYKIFLLEKEPRYESGIIKHGFHLHFISLTLNKEDLKTVHSIVKAVLRKEDTNEIGEFGVNKRLYDIIDDVSTKPWLLYGASKTPESMPYLITKAYTVKNNLELTEESDYKNILIGAKYHERELTRDNIKDYLIGIMSIRNSKNFSIQIPNELKVDATDVYEETGIPIELKQNRNIMKKEVIQHINISDEKIGELVLGLDDSRSDNYNDWVKIAMILVSASKNNPENEEFFKGVFHLFSQKSEKYSQTVCENKWKNLMRSTYENGVGVGTLIYFGRQDGIISDTKDFLCDFSPKFIPVFDYPIAKHVKNSITEMYMTHKDYGCYKLDSTSWKEVSGWDGIFKKHITDWASVYTNRLREQDLDEEETKRLSALEKKIRNYSSLNNLSKSLFDLYFNENIEQLFVQKDNMIAFKNCVFDIINWKIIAPNPKHYFSNRIEHDLIDWADVPLDNKEFIHDFFSKIFYDKELREYTLKNVARFITGKNSFKQFQFWTGSGNNGKSMFVKLLEFIFGKASMKTPKSIVTSFTQQQGGANPEIFRLKDARIAIVDEVTKNDIINPGQLKLLSGDDKLYGRDLYQKSKDIGEISPAFFPVLITNEVPIISRPDTATWNRIRLIRFESKFTGNIQEYILENPDEDPNKVFKIDHRISEKLKINAKYFLSYFMHILLEHETFEDFNGEEIIPEKVSEGLNNFKESQNILRQYLEENFVVDVNSTEVFTLNKLMKDYNKNKPKIQLNLSDVEAAIISFINKNSSVVLSGNIVKGLSRVMY
ncbi:ATPase [Dasineura jujubifolia toursvirus 2a]|nr:ATPase [Dasineura jujubifolia toursvirus 2a]